MPVDPADQSVRLAVSDILSKFLSKRELNNALLSTLRDQVIQEYTLNLVEVHGLSGSLCGSPDLHLKDHRRFMILEPVADKILPLLTLKTSNNWVNFRAYALLTMFDECAELQALAFRFETDEGVPQTNGVTGSHDFCHAQLCRYIDGKTRATTPSWLPDSQPSFPLDAKDQIGLVLCMLTSLYGGRRVVEKLSTIGDRDLRKHLKKVRALT